jgi:hypothetical protein
VDSQKRAASVPPLRDLVGISGGELARWIKVTTPNDRPHVIRVLETTASILRDELSPQVGKSAEEFLLAELADGPRNAAALEPQAAALGITVDDLARGRSKLGVISRQWPGTPRTWRLPDGEAGTT